jgi:hypothetical protein
MIKKSGLRGYYIYLATSYATEKLWFGSRQVLGRGKRPPSSLIRPHRVCGTPNLLCNGHQAPFPETERSRREFDHLFPSSSEVRMCGAQLLVPSTHSYSTEEQLYKVTANHTVTRIYLSSTSYQNRFSFYGYYIQ